MTNSTKARRNVVNVFFLVAILLVPATLAWSAGADEEPVEEKVTITWARGVDHTGASQAIIDEFNASQDRITVELLELPADEGAQHDAYVTSFSGEGTEYDVINSNVIWPPEFADAGFALPVDRFVERDNINLDDYVEGYIDAYTFRGQMWGMPWYGNAGLLYYRTDIVDTPPSTWDELIEMAGEYAGQGGTTYGYAFQADQYEGLVCNAVEFIASYGGEIMDGDGNVTVNNPATIKGLEKLVEIAQADFVPADIVNFKEHETLTSFIAGDVVFARNWPYMWGIAQDEEESDVAGKVGTAPLPAGDAGSASALGGWGIMINRYSEHPEAAWEFVKFLTGEPGQRIHAIEGAQLPTYTPLYDDQEVMEENPAFKMFEEGIRDAVPRPMSPIYPEISDIIQIELSRAIAGQQTVTEAVETMERRMNEALRAAE